jgi:glyoxylase-like metal-dependent hydrolase (beta-lactamase superfamily II)
VARDVLRICAPNPSPMTLSGTNSYLVGSGRGRALIDPGPDDAAHRAALRAALPPGARIEAILVTHAHGDHSAGAGALAREWGAPVLAFGPCDAGRSPGMAALAAAATGTGGPAGEGAATALGGGEGVDTGFAPDRLLADGEELAGAGWRLTALHTPGHMGNHLSFEMEGLLFTGDLALADITTVISPPDGDLVQFLDSCRRLAARGPRRLLPGHGPAAADGRARLMALVAHREARSEEILATLSAHGPATALELAERIYAGLGPGLLPAAARTVLAHLIALAETGAVASEGPPSPAARFAATRPRNAPLAP